MQELTIALKTPLYLVGGGVRDLVLGRPSLDVDLVVEGDAPYLARELATAIGGRCVVHRQFGTASVEGGGFAFDLATARIETYPRPGALPLVRPGTLAQDLARRDFAINAMALALTGAAAGELVDPHDGLGDCARGIIRVLHDDSFVDDATRILRAVRYEARLGFRLEPYSLSLLQRDVGRLATVNAPRLRLEFRRILEEGAPEEALGRGRELGMLASIHPSLRFDEGVAAAYRRAREQMTGPLLTYLALLALRLSPAAASGLARRLTTSKAQRQAMEAAPAALAEVSRFKGKAIPSQVVRALQAHPEESLWAVALAAPGEEERELARCYLVKWRQVRPALDGHALRRLGVLPGPTMGEVLARLREGRLDGWLRTRQDEQSLVKEMVGASGASAQG